MAHFARVAGGIVQDVMVAEQGFIDNYVCDKPGKWIQTSYNTRGGIHYDPSTGEPSEDQSKALRKNYAGRGYTYDKRLDAFYAPQPYPSWTLNETTCLWEAPVEQPSDPGDGSICRWNETDQQWDLIP